MKMTITRNNGHVVILDSDVGSVHIERKGRDFFWVDSPHGSSQLADVENIRKLWSALDGYYENWESSPEVVAILEYSTISEVKSHLKLEYMNYVQNLCFACI